ncbi:MAG: chemotaxis-specific protein-glutamate methyltransferase CheB [bacterium]|nr:chemotaxis-specific protein-glutamate methyltransferase CheB [bacterium]
MSDALKIMVVDDTITYRQILSKVVESIEGTELLASASSGRTALMKMEANQPDLVFLDVMMPEMDGIETLKHIKAKYPKVEVVMVSGADKEAANITLQSLEAGALDFVAKPQASSMQEGLEQLTQALAPVIEAVHARRRKARPTPAGAPRPAPAPVATPASSEARKPRHYDAVVLGISTGGPNALHELFSTLKGNLTVPVLIVQHMPPMFTASLAERLDSVTSMKVKEAEAGESILAGNVYIAPGGKHMGVYREGGQLKVQINDLPPVNHCKPAVDVLFESVAKLGDMNPLAVVMTGMGRDGAKGVVQLRQQGAYCLIQDEASSVVWGMPGAVAEVKAADEILPLSRLGARMLELTQP